jgi:hypothetical protein
MNIKSGIAKHILLLVAFGMVITSCKKLGKPPLGDYPSDDQQLPPGELRFFTSFDQNSTEFRYQVADSISQNPSFFSSNPLTIIPGVRGNAVQGKNSTAINYLNPNDFAKSTSFSVSMWLKNTLPTGGKAQFTFSVTDKDFWCNCSMFMLVDHSGSGSTADSAVVKMYVVDNKGEKWFELVGNNRMKGLLDNNWHHVVFTYNETTSDMVIYKDGAAYATINWPGHGKYEITPSSVGNFILGGFNKHAGVVGPPDDWMQSWQGGIDQFRLYNKALSAAEVQSLFTSKG